MISINDILEELRKHNPEAIEDVIKAYNLAAEIHKDQYRQSGEPYIVHPLSVAKILLDNEVWDKDTICAALLHDTLEDSDYLTKEDIERIINPTVAELVDGVTKISRLNFSTKQEQNLANTRKIINGLSIDARIILIKEADRLHNMRTLGFKTPYKQRENALETMELYVPLAYHTGVYRIKSELEDLSLQYLDPDAYKKNAEIRNQLIDENKDTLKEVSDIIKTSLQEQEIESKIKIRIKNIYGIYDRLKEVKNLDNIHDLYSLKIMVDEVKDCYLALGNIHSRYHPINDKFKDYICNPKTNMYQSLHTTVFGPKDLLIQNQIRTFEMDKIASFGISAYWNQKNGPSREETQENLKKRCQFVKSLIEIDNCFSNNSEFIAEVKRNLLTDFVYTYTPTGKVIELPKGATPIDFAYYVSDKLGNNMTGCIVNEQEVPVDYILASKDRVKITTDGIIKRDGWEEKAHTAKAKMKLKEYPTIKI